MAGHWLAELDGSKVTVEVPASSANLGAGYDCLGVALAIIDRIELEVRVWSRGEIELTIEGEGRNELNEDRDNRFVRGLEGALRAARGEIPDGVGWRISMHNDIPLARGLGSSAAATVGGILVGNALAGEALSMPEMLVLACEIEGHPDNAAAAIAGGLTLAFGDGVIRLDPHPALRPVVLLPTDVRLPTAAAREVLPDAVSRADAVYNASHAAAAVVALTSEPDLLTQVLHDRLHQDVRLALVPSVKSVFDELWTEGVPVCLSGAGPSLLAFELGGRAVPDPGEGWRLLRPDIRARGAEIR